VHRVLTSSRYAVTLRELDEWWSFEDLLVANDVISMLEDAEAEGIDVARRKARKERER
jgi:hypothetical protein